MRRKKTPKQLIKKRLEKLVKEIVKIRDGNVCQFSGELVEGSNCHASHVIPVSADGRLAFDPLNLKVLSYHWHLNWWHKHPIAAGDWFKTKFPTRWEYLHLKHLENKTKGPISMTEYEEREVELKDMLNSARSAELN